MIGMKKPPTAATMSIRPVAVPVLMGLALWRSRSVPRWLAVLFFAGLEVAQQASSAGPVVIVYMLPFAAAMILLAARIWQAAGAAPASSSGGLEADPNLEDLGTPAVDGAGAY
jgi:hypothetical protein